jgi:hypothetical protein
MIEHGGVAGGGLWGNLWVKDEVLWGEVTTMEQELDSGKMAARPSHEAIEKDGEDSIDDFKSGAKKIDQLAMKGAKRAENRIVANEEKIPGSTIFSK